MGGQRPVAFQQSQVIGAVQGDAAPLFNAALCEHMRKALAGRQEVQSGAGLVSDLSHYHLFSADRAVHKDSTSHPPARLSGRFFLQDSQQ